MTTQMRNQKTDELVKDLQDKGLIVGVEDLSQYLRTAGVVVSEHIGRRRSYIEVSPKMYGVDLSTKEQATRDFLKSHVKQGKLTFISADNDKALTNVENALRVARKRASIGFDGKFMVTDSYKEFYQVFEKKKEEYMALRDKIVSEWDSMLEGFRSSLDASLRDLKSVDGDSLAANIMNRIPTKEAYGASFYMELRISAFPIIENLNMFDESIQEQIKEGSVQESVSSMYQILGSGLDLAFTNCCNLLAIIEKNGRLNSRSTTALQEGAKRMRKENVFANSKIAELADNLEAAGSTDDTDDAAELAEHILAKTYGYAVELDLTDALKTINKCPFSDLDLLSIYEMLGGSDSWVCAVPEPKQAAAV